MLLVTAAAAGAATTVRLRDVAFVRWDGAVAGANLGGGAPNGLPGSMVEVGNVNGQGGNLGDIAVMHTGADGPFEGVFLLFFLLGGNPSARDLANLAPTLGFLIRTTGLDVEAVSAAGDQNGDGVDDVMLGARGSVVVVYGMRNADVTALPQCAPPGATRCLDLATLTPAQGYRIVSGESDDGFGERVTNADVDGDAIDDLVIGAPARSVIDADRGAAYVVWGGRTATADPVVLSTLPASEVLRIDGPAAGARLGEQVRGLGDFAGHGDGRNDLAVSSGPAVYVIYAPARGSGPINLESFGPAQGFRLGVPPVTFGGFAINARDVNGDGRPDLAFGSSFSLIDTDGFGAIIYGPAEAPADPIPVDAPTAEQGYVLAAGEEGFAQFGTDLGSLPPIDFSPFPPNFFPGDLNGDGVPDLVVGASRSSLPDPATGALPGAVEVVFGRRPTPPGPIVLGHSLTPDVGFALVGIGDGDGAGTAVATLPITTNDGLPRLFASAPGASENGRAGAGAVYLVLGSSLMPFAVTGPATRRAPEPSLAGEVNPNGRATTAYFEYGLTTSYGQRTPDQAIGAGADPVAVTVSVSGLAPATTYHYRVVAVNDLGLTHVGVDRTLTTQLSIPRLPYTCLVQHPLIPAGTTSTASIAASAAARAPAVRGEPVALSDVVVDLQNDDPALLGGGAFGSQASSATLGPNGSASLGFATLEDDGVAVFTGGTGSVVAIGEPGTTMSVTLDQVVLRFFIFIAEGVLTCDPDGAPAVLTADIPVVPPASWQTILGKSLTVKDPKPGVDPAKRKIVGSASEKNSPNTLVGDPTDSSAGGAILQVFANGTTPSAQEFVLPQGTTGKGKPFWSGSASKGFKYKDSKGEQGPVKSVTIKRSGGGSFSIKAVISGKNGPVEVVPPNPGTDGCMALDLGIDPAGVGDRYSVRFGPEGTVRNTADRLFKVTKPTVEDHCPSSVTSTTTPPTSTTTTSTSTTTTTAAPTTTTSTTSTTSTTTTTSSTTTSSSTTTTEEPTTTTSTSTTTTTTIYSSPSRAFLTPPVDLLG